MALKPFSSQRLSTRRFNPLNATPTPLNEPYFPYTTLLLSGNGTNGAQNNTFLDGSTNNFTITRNGNTTQGTFSPFSQTGWGNYFNGSSSLSIANNAAFQMSTGDFCLEGWFYCTGTSVMTPFGTNYLGSSNYIIVTLNRSGAGQIDAAIQDSSSISTSTNSFSNNTWNHLVYCRTSGTVSLFLNGNRVATGTDSSATNPTGAFQIGTNTALARPFSGYLSNVRLIKGSNPYDATLTTLTVPTSPLTAISGTSLLTCQSNRFIDNSTNNFSITTSGSPTVVAFSPFNPTASWSAATNGGSGYFDGNGDYLDPPSNAAFQFGTGDFCLEGWIYPTDTTNRTICGQRTGSSGDNSWILSCNPTNASSWGYVYFHTDNTAVFGSSVAINTNAWTHVVFTCVSGRYRIFQNGILSGTTLGSYNFNQTTGPRLGSEIRTSAGAAAAFLGWMSGWRITKGGIPSAYSTASTTVGTSVFTPPSAPATNSESLTAGSLSLLLNFTNAGIYDATSKNNLETVGNAQISTTQSKWGGSSIAFDGTGDYLVTNVSTSDLYSFGTGDWTVEFWVRFNNTTADGCIFDTRNATDTLNVSILRSTTTIIFQTGGATRITSGTITSNVWYHVALARSGTSTKMFIDGTQAGSTYTDTTSYTAGANRPIVGAVSLSGYVGISALNGYVNDLRVTKGYARYTTNFTPPTEAFLTL